jgi:hypothetical protein
MNNSPRSCFRVVALCLFVFGLAVSFGGCLQAEEAVEQKTEENTELAIEKSAGNNELQLRIINPEADLEILDQATVSVYDANLEMVINEVEVSADGEFMTLVFPGNSCAVRIIRPPVYSDGTTYVESEYADLQFYDGRWSIEYWSPHSDGGQVVVINDGEPLEVTFDLSVLEKTVLTKTSLEEMIDYKLWASEMVVSRYEDLSNLDPSDLSEYDAFVLKRNKMKAEALGALRKELEATDEGDFEAIRRIYHSYCSIDATMQSDY